MKKRPCGRTARTLWVWAMAATMVLAVGCEREEYQPQAVAADQETVDGETGSETADQGPGVTTNSHHYSMRVDSTAIATGDSEQVMLTVVPGTDLKINLDFPWSIEFQDTPAVELGASHIDSEQMELSEEKAMIPVSVTASEAGQHRIEATGNFSVCNDDICHLLRGETVELVVEAH